MRWKIFLAVIFSFVLGFTAGGYYPRMLSWNGQNTIVQNEHLTAIYQSGRRAYEYLGLHLTKDKTASKETLGEHTRQLLADISSEVEREAGSNLDRSGNRATSSTNDFEILDWSWSGPNNGYFEINGELKNNGRTAMGVELQLICRDENKKVVYSSGSFWPASIKNIPPGSTWPHPLHG